MNNLIKKLQSEAREEYFDEVHDCNMLTNVELDTLIAKAVERAGESERERITVGLRVFLDGLLEGLPEEKIRDLSNQLQTLTDI
jgi:predicted amino acid racemase